MTLSKMGGICGKSKRCMSDMVGCISAVHCSPLLINLGPIVRINPYELHVSDPNFYDELNAGCGRKRDKYHRFVRLYGTDKGTLVTLDHDLYRIRRSTLNPFFSKANVRKLEPIIQRKAEKVLSRMIDVESTG